MTSTDEGFIQKAVKGRGAKDGTEDKVMSSGLVGRAAERGVQEGHQKNKTGSSYRAAAPKTAIRWVQHQPALAHGSTVAYHWRANEIGDLQWVR